MTGKTWLWIALGALLLISVCCIGMVIGGIVGQQGQPATPSAAGTVDLSLAMEPMNFTSQNMTVPMQCRYLR